MVIEYKRIFIDTAPIIYLLEKNPTYYERALEFFQSCFKQKKEDKCEYVRKSVGNALRDISKKFPDLIKLELDSWKLENKEIK